MAPSAVCISRAIGAEGEEVGRLVADALGFRYVDEEILLAAAEKEGLHPEHLAKVERSRTGLSRLEVDIVTGGAFDEIQRSLIRVAIHEMAAAGSVVIVAHAASLALAGNDRVLRVLITATPDVRAARLAQTEQLDEREAAKRIASSDKERAAYIKRFYGLDRELPSHYDLVVSTDRLSPSDACALVLDAAGAFDS
ncbi:MAG TPA: cytidylate kinase-like family protein [Gaiellaceae bacterium]